MATPTYTALATTTLSASAASVTFSSIDQSYGDLVLVANTKAASAVSVLELQINGDTGTNYSWVRAEGTGSSTASSNNASDDAMIGGVMDDSNDSIQILQFMDYSATDKHKTVLVRGNAVGFRVMMIAGRYASTSAITSIKIFEEGTPDFEAGSTFSLYGVAK